MVLRIAHLAAQRHHESRALEAEYRLTMGLPPARRFQMENATYYVALHEWKLAQERPARKALWDTVRALSTDEQLDLEALMWVGRNGDAFTACRNHADTFPNDERARLSYLLEKPLEEYLSNALERWAAIVR
jgi:hypothetical protein